MEIWKNIDWINGMYQVSNFGVIKNRLTGRVIKQSLSGRNYLKVGLLSDGKQVTKHVHDLVITAFHGVRPKGLTARFIDGDKSNVNANNLKWGKFGDESIGKLKISKSEDCNCQNCETENSTSILNGVKLCDTCVGIEKIAISKLYKVIGEMIDTGIPAKSILERFDLHNSLLD